MRRFNPFFVGLLLLTLPPLVAAQGTSMRMIPQAGDQEIVLAGTGTSTDDFDDFTLGLTGDYGWYWNNATLVGIRQSINYTELDEEDDIWNGSTRAFGDYHFGRTSVRPFLGGSFGGIYGDRVNESWFAGLEGGVKFYPIPRAFLLARAEFQWFFDSSDEIDDRFDDGSWAYTFGIGYNF